jgi:hypothetical protein
VRHPLTGAIAYGTTSTYYGHMTHVTSPKNKIKTNNLVLEMSVNTQLRKLYLRRIAVNELIRSLEQYCDASGVPVANGPKGPRAVSTVLPFPAQRAA